jgi:hypothetical protein
MHFIFHNRKIAISGPRIVDRLGIMHLCVVNIRNWIKYVMIEEKITNIHIQQTFERHHRNVDHVIEHTINNHTNVGALS